MTNALDDNNVEQPESVAATQSATSYVIVTQVKSYRVVYFTDDPNYQPPMDGDWYYVSSYQGALPEGMTLRNCWGWRFNGGVFIDAREAPAKSQKETLLDHNRKALRRILNEKIDSIREPYCSTVAMGEKVRILKHAEAVAYLGKPTADANYPYLQSLAVARNFSLQEAAELIVHRAEQTEQVLLATERIREKFGVSITYAQTEDELLQLRTWLLDQVYPELTEQFKNRVDNTRPPKRDDPLPEAERLHEIMRLKAQLREKINAKRDVIHSGYVQNDTAQKHKAKLAQILLAAQGKRPENIDFSMLEVYADARQLSLQQAAELFLDSLAEASKILVETEQLKDRLLAKIDTVKTLNDIDKISKELKGL